VPEPQVQEETPRSLAERYLEDVTDAFDLSTISQDLNASPTVDLTRDYVELRFGGEIQKSLHTEYGCIGGMTYYLDPDFGEG